METNHNKSNTSIQKEKTTKTNLHKGGSNKTQRTDRDTQIWIEQTKQHTDLDQTSKSKPKGRGDTYLPCQAASSNVPTSFGSGNSGGEPISPNKG